MLPMRGLDICQVVQVPEPSTVVHFPRGSLVDLRFATFLRIVLEFHRRSCCCHPGFVDGFFGKGARNKKSWAQMAA